MIAHKYNILFDKKNVIDFSRVVIVVLVVIIKKIDYHYCYLFSMFLRQFTVFVHNWHQ
jgi:hypothetical protein